MKETVRDLLSFRGRERELITISQHLTVAEAIEKMTSPGLEGVKSIGAILVTKSMKDPTPVGIMTERDILERVYARKRMPDSVAVKTIMTHRPVPIGIDDPLNKALRSMIVGKFGHLPVIDQGVAVTMISESDLLEAIDHFQEVDTQMDRVDLLRH